jgi:hypothetical protein
MGTSALTTATTLPGPLALIAQSDKVESTKTKYTRALAPYLDAGGNLADVGALSEHADTLSDSRRRHLRSAVNLWAQSTRTLLKAHDTPETHVHTEAACNRLDALAQVIKVKATLCFTEPGTISLRTGT